MNRLLKALPFTALFMGVSTNIHADVIHQLAGTDSAGTTVVIENSGAEHWEVVFEGTLGNCEVNKSDQPDRPVRNTFHQPLGNNQFAFGCTNGYVFIAENGKPVESVLLPTNYWYWYDEIYLKDGLGVGLLWKPSPVFMAFSKEFNNASGKNWLFVTQKGNLFIIDLNTKQLVTIDSWTRYLGFYGGIYLRMGSDQKGIDYTQPMAGFDIFRDKQNKFHLLGALDLPDKKTEKPELLIQSLPLTNGVPDKQWKDTSSTSTESHEHNPFNYASDKFKCDTGMLPAHSRQHLPRVCNWPDKLPAPPSPRELKDLTGGQPQMDHYQSHITFERVADNTDDSVRKRTNENAFSKEDL
ncbi:hypothetical protein [Endozoicomonas lisbonensis]|uniref:Uncharacterized protein n=1 Tax=Endozoicomonas lisbonensis TaxID=3120522 RepID=A0ABV2SMB2_9GAMM